jgi:hypothetical protein
MKTEIPFSEWPATLASWSGTMAQVWMYHTTHKRIALRLDRDGDSHALYIAGSGCSWISGPFGWFNAQISILDDPDKTGMLIVDTENSFEIKCCGVGLFLAPISSFDESFENWLDT